MIKWQRLFGLTLKDFFTGTSYTVDLEKDLSIKQQMLDVVIIEKMEGRKPPEIPCCQCQIPKKPLGWF